MTFEDTNRRDKRRAYCTRCGDLDDVSECKHQRSVREKKRKEAKERAEREFFEEVNSTSARTPEPFSVDAAKKRTMCHGCEDPIVKGCLRIGYQFYQEYPDRVVPHTHFFHVPCWHKSPHKPAHKCFSRYRGFRLLSMKIQVDLQNSSAASPKFIIAGDLKQIPETRRNNKRGHHNEPHPGTYYNRARS